MKVLDQEFTAAWGITQQSLDFRQRPRIHTATFRLAPSSSILFADTAFQFVSPINGCHTKPMPTTRLSLAYLNTDLSSFPISAGFLVTLMPHSSITANFSAAVPLPPEMIAPA